MLSPYLFAIYVDSVVKKAQSSGHGCYVRHTCVSILLYADDILLLAPSVSSLQMLLCMCETELEYLDMSINVKKSSCIRIGARYTAKCSRVTTLKGCEVLWSDTLRYLGVYITAGHRFCCSLCNAKRSFYRAFNCIFGKVGRIANENVVMELLKAKCLPSMLYGLEACPINKTQIRSLEFVLNNASRKIFLTMSYDVASECLLLFNCSVSDSIYNRKVKFLNKLKYSDNIIHRLFARNICDELDDLPYKFNLI